MATNTSQNSGASGSSNQRKSYTPEQKLKIVLESFQRDTTIGSIRIKYGVAASALHRWREEFKKVPLILPSANGATAARPRGMGDLITL